MPLTTVLQTGAEMNGIRVFFIKKSIDYIIYVAFTIVYDFFLEKTIAYGFLPN